MSFARHAPSDRPRYPEFVDEHGEDPARFLYSSEQLSLARIRGIDDEDLLAAYLEVEVDRASGPRREIVAAINQRKAALENEGN